MSRSVPNPSNQSSTNPYGQACQSNNHPPNATPILANRLPIHTDNAQIVNGTRTIGDLPKCLRTPSFTAHSRYANPSPNPIHCQCSANTLPIQYQYIANPMSIHCQSDVNPVSVHRQYLTNPCQTIANLLPIRADPSTIFDQSVPIHRQSYTNPCQSTANLIPIDCQSDVNSVPIRFQSNQSKAAHISQHLGTNPLH